MCSWLVIGVVVLGGVAFEDGKVFFYVCWLEGVELEAFVGVLVQFGVKASGEVFAGDEEDGDVFFHGSKGDIVIIVRGRDAGVQVSGKPELLFYCFEVDYQGIWVAWFCCDVDFLICVLEKDGGDFVPFVTRKGDGDAMCFHGSFGVVGTRSPVLRLYVIVGSGQWR